MFTESILSPTFVIRKDICRANIQGMKAKADRNGVAFRPHFKTHQSHAVGRLFREVGIAAITVSSVQMAQYFAEDGWQDITIAFPLNWRELPAIEALAANRQIHVLVESVATAQYLVENSRTPLHVWIEVDAGYHRTGVPYDQDAELQAIARKIADAPNLQLEGVLSHAGNTYSQNRERVGGVYYESVDRIRGAVNSLAQQGFDDLKISVGDTPSTSILDDLGNVDEIRPGCFVYYDLQQVAIGACELDDIAAAAACPVVSKRDYDGYTQVVMYGGGVHLSKDAVMGGEGERFYGRVALPDIETTWRVLDASAKVVSLSQEHGVIHVSHEAASDIQIGDLLYILPAHTCMTANLLRSNTLLV